MHLDINPPSQPLEDDSIDELPPLRLEYDTWTTILPDKSTPPQAETDLPLGRARIPANWSLQLVLLLVICVCAEHASSHLDQRDANDRDYYFTRGQPHCP